MNLKDLTAIEYLIVFIALILPGFIIIKMIKLKVPHKDFLLKDMLFEALSYSLLNLVLIAWLPYLLIYNEYHSFYVFMSFIVSFIIFPIFLAFMYIKIISSEYFMSNFNIQVPTAWDWYFSKRPNCTLLIKLKNGSEVIGYFGEKSYATSYPNEGSIYLEKVYIRNSDKLEIVENSDGIIIKQDAFDTIEFYKIGENNE